MKIYTVSYRDSDYTKDVKTVLVAARSVLKATQKISIQKYLRYSGSVISVTEFAPVIVIAN